MYQVQAHLDVFHNWYSMSKTVSGLCALARRGLITLHFAAPLAPGADGFFDPQTVCLTVSDSSGRAPRLLAIELWLRSDTFTMEVLNRCDVYLKRSYYGPAVAKLPEKLVRRYIPSGSTTRVGMCTRARSSIGFSLLSCSVAPCQDHSAPSSGPGRNGINGARSGIFLM